ncbi:MAG: IreB family regulatory phosphoprotein [Clostridia bacterium]|nr:IreB family regulatory phosphoprotein [Clostridia bacterium]
MNTESQSTPMQDTPVDPRKILRQVYDSLTEKGYNPIGQIVGYLLSEDPTYITNYNNARALIRQVDRDELMSALVKNYLELE